MSPETRVWWQERLYFAFILAVLCGFAAGILYSLAPPSINDGTHAPTEDPPVVTTCEIGDTCLPIEEHVDPGRPLPESVTDQYR